MPARNVSRRVVSGRIPLAAPVVVCLLVFLVPVACDDGTGPEVLHPRLFADLDAGAYHTCGVQGDGTLLCWGRNDYGQLGDGTTEDRRTPTPVQSGPVFRSVSAGWLHTCGVTRDGGTYCWGDNSFGQLGNGERGPQEHLPVPVIAAGRFTAVAAGHGYTCGLTEAGAVFCWGENLGGSLGAGIEEEFEAVPQEVASNAVFTSVTAGPGHACALDEDGQAWCWGSSRAGELGAPATETCYLDRPCSRTPLPVEGGHAFQTLGAGSSSTCGIDDAGELLCWGGNSQGQLGDGTTEDRPSPSPVVGARSWSEVDGGFGRTCGIAEGGEPWCWGGPPLGDGSAEGALVPVRVSVSTLFRSISVGEGHTCALAREGTAWCWGDNDYGQLGDGSPSLGSNIPVIVVQP